jgi:integrase
MRGFMRQRGESWELRVYVGRDEATGRRRYVNKTVRGGKREAERALAELVTHASRGDLRNSRATVAQLLERWFELVRADFSPSTERETRSIIDRTLLPGLGEMPLNRLTVADIDRFYRRLLKAGGRNGGPLAPATVRRSHVVLRRALAPGRDVGMLRPRSGRRRRPMWLASSASPGTPSWPRSCCWPARRSAPKRSGRFPVERP